MFIVSSVVKFSCLGNCTFKCILKGTTPEEQTGNSAYVYAGLSAAGVVVLLVTVVIGIYCLKKRRDNSTR